MLNWQTDSIEPDIESLKISQIMELCAYESVVTHDLERIQDSNEICRIGHRFVRKSKGTLVCYFVWFSID